MKPFIKAVSPDDPVVKPIMDAFGFDGYGRFIAVLDFCRNFEIDTLDIQLIVNQARSNKRGAATLLPLFQECLTKVLAKFGESFTNVSPKFDQSLPKLEGQNPHGSTRAKNKKEKIREEKNNTQPEAENNSISDFSDKSPKPKVTPQDDAEFEQWYDAYPRRQAKGAAKKAYWAARKKVSADVLLGGISRYRANKPHYADWKMPATWLNAECWADDDYKPGNTPESKQFVKKENPHIEAWKAGRRFFHEGRSKTYQASQLQPWMYNFRREPREKETPDSFRVAGEFRARFEEFVIEEE